MKRKKQRKSRFINHKNIVSLRYTVSILMEAHAAAFRSGAHGEVEDESRTMQIVNLEDCLVALADNHIPLQRF